jgi:hypothetical protein
MRVRESSRSGSILEVVIGEVGLSWQVDTFRHLEASIPARGRYTTIALTLDPRLADLGDGLTEALAQHFRSAYRRLEAYVVKLLLDIEYKVANHLYAEVRSVLDEHLASQVGLYALLDRENATYLLDPQAILAVLNYATQSRMSTSPSPLKLTALLVRGWVRPEETVAKHVLGSVTPISVEFAEMSYPTAPELEIAEESWYGRAALVQPLVRDGHIRLVAAYPVSCRSHIEPVLENISGRLAEILERHAKETSRLGRKSRDGTGHWDAGLIAEIIGRFVGGAARANK